MMREQEALREVVVKAVETPKVPHSPVHSLAHSLNLTHALTHVLTHSLSTVVVNRLDGVRGLKLLAKRCVIILNLI